MASLILGKVYRVMPDATAGKDGLIRVIDESGEDYLFSEDTVRGCRLSTSRTPEVARPAEGRLNGSVPADNRFVGRAGDAPEVYSLGHRNSLGHPSAHGRSLGSENRNY
jgi:hypothetical protein